LREYNEGKYQDALRDYNQLLEKKKDDPRLHFNAGAAAYQNKQYEEATNQLNAALTSPDLQLQQRAYYNLGNSLFRLGQQMPDAAKKQEAWENAMKQYESALKLNQQDNDAKFNQEFVQKQLEELKKQQQQQSQSKDNSDKQQKQNQDQKDQAKDDSQKDQQKKSQDQQNQQNQQNQQDQQKQDKSQSDQNQNSQAKNKEDEKKSEEDQKKEDQAKAQKQKDEAEKKKEMAQNQASGEPKDKSEEEAKREAAMMAAGEMTPQQAQQLLDAEKDDEQVLRLAPPNKNTSRSRSYKNW
jgi:Ca-activated chloride channel family protein